MTSFQLKDHKKRGTRFRDTEKLDNLIKVDLDFNPEVNIMHKESSEEEHRFI